MTLSPSIETHLFADDGIVPNNPILPLVLYRGALGSEGDLAARCEDMFEANGWPGAWRNGIYGHHHYHSTAHEVLGIARGSARVRLGGESGATVELRAGDVVVIPAGFAHKRESASGDLLVIGSYPTSCWSSVPTRKASAPTSARPILQPTTNPLAMSCAWRCRPATR
jgi:uncharacterized protein YjlB